LSSRSKIAIYFGGKANTSFASLNPSIARELAQRKHPNEPKQNNTVSPKHTFADRGQSMLLKQVVKKIVPYATTPKNVPKTNNCIALTNTRPLCTGIA